MVEGNLRLLVLDVIPKDSSHYVRWSSNHPDVVKVSNEGLLMACKPGNAVITASTINGDYSASCNIIVEELPIPSAIDMGLSVKWASYNLGASIPEEIGNYYAWGETESKNTKHSWYTYKWCVGTNRINDGTAILTKYNTTANRGYNSFVDGITELLPDDDVAYVKLSGNWRIPTTAEWNELLNSCTIQKTTYNEVNGYVLTSNITGNTIFLPETGWFDSTQHNDGMNYWSSSLAYSSYSSSYYDYSGEVIRDNGSGLRVGSQDRYYGLAIRPVCDE